MAKFKQEKWRKPSRSLIWSHGMIKDNIEGDESCVVKNGAK